jgi:hypothetical protein
VWRKQLGLQASGVAYKHERRCMRAVPSRCSATWLRWDYCRTER